MKKMKFNGAQPIGEVLTPEEMKAIPDGFGSGSGSCTCTLHMKDGSTQDIPSFKAFNQDDCREQCGSYCSQNENCVQYACSFHD